MKFDPSVPIYLQVVDAIKNDLVTGRILPGDKLPSGRDLAMQYTINPNTAARVYQEMDRQQLCFTKRGMGTFATEDAERIAQLKTEMAEQLLSQFLDGCSALGISKDDAIRMIKERTN